MTCTLPVFLVNHFLRWVWERVCKTAEVGEQLFFFRIIKPIDTKRPRAFLLENVKGLVTHHPETLRIILGRLRGAHTT